MKKFFIVFLVMSFFCIPTVTAEESGTVEVKNWDREINELFMGNYFSQEELDSMYQDRIDAYNNDIWPDWWNFVKDVRVSQDRYDEEYERMYNAYYSGIDYNNGLKVSLMYTPKYMLQYANNDCLGYLLSDEYYWAVFSDDLGRYFYDDNGVYSMTIEELYDKDFSNNFGIEDETYDLLKNSEKIESQLLDMGVTEITDLKLFTTMASTNISLMYIKTDTEEYLVKLSGEYGEMPSIEIGKVYTAEEVVKAIADKTDARWIKRQNLIPLVEKEKIQYEDEAWYLYWTGVLKGTDKGLELLKPLTRAEAVAMLIRAMGMENETVKYTESVFSDISSDSWASSYAALGKEIGLIKGVSESEFAPDELVTLPQFATFVIRAVTGSDIENEEATQICIDANIITSEETETMDFFTRGDAVKFIWELRNILWEKANE